MSQVATFVRPMAMELTKQLTWIAGVPKIQMLTASSGSAT
jgi:hypothetical protein